MSAPQLPQPSPEHLMLQTHVGVWDVACRLWMFPDQPPIEYAAIDTVTPLGPFWVVARFEARLPQGGGYEGLAQVGFDSAKGRFISTYIGSMEPFLSTFEGTWDPETRILHQTGGGSGPYGPSTQYRSEDHILGDDERTFRMWVRADGVPEHVMLEYRYTRRK